MDAPTIHQEPRHYKPLGKTADETTRRRIASQLTIRDRDIQDNNYAKPATYDEEVDIWVAMYRYVTQSSTIQPQWLGCNVFPEVRFIDTAVTNNGRSPLTQAEGYARRNRGTRHAGYHQWTAHAPRPRNQRTVGVL